jgi:signal transduction histidine kinase
MDIKKFLIQNRMMAQIVYGVVLIVLIPLLITFNTVFIIKKYNQSLDTVLRGQALSLGRTIAASIESDLPWADFVQARVETLIRNNTAIQSISVLTPIENADKFMIIAANDKALVNSKSDFYFYKQAWAMPKNEGLAISSVYLESTDSNDNSGHYWLVAMPIAGSDGSKQALINIKISSSIVDEMTKYNRNISIYILIGTVMIVILFLLVAVRLWDYALLYKKIKEVDKMKDEFISIASHELRTPVTGIRGFTSMIVDGTFGKVNDKVRSSAIMIMKESDRLGVLVEDLLDVSRIEQNRIKIDAHPVEIGHIINDVIENLRGQAEKKNLSLVFKSNSTVLPIINIDIDRFKQVMVNLIGNAIKYTEKGGIEVMTRDKQKDAVLEIFIKDTGIGMSGKDRERLFEKFYRVQNDKTKKITGTGLGLWITKKLVELMGGNIAVDSMEGVGTQFIIKFPLSKG